MLDCFFFGCFLEIVGVENCGLVVGGSPECNENAEIFVWGIVRRECCGGFAVCRVVECFREGI